MLVNYFKTSFRSIWRNKLFSAINVLGLAIGISAALVIYLIVDYDLGFEKFQRDPDRIYRVVSEFEFSGEKFKNSGVTLPLGPTLRQEVPGLELVVPFFRLGTVKVSIPVEGKPTPTVYKKQERFIYADVNYFNLIDYNWIAGSKITALKDPFQAVLTESLAKQYFPSLTPAEVIGKTLTYEDSIHTKITGIVEDLKQRTDFTFNGFISFSTMETSMVKDKNLWDWGNTNSQSQVLLKLRPNQSVASAKKAVMTVFTKHHTQDKDDHSKTALNLQPLSDLHFNTEFDTFDQRVAHKPTLYGLLIVAAFLLLLGCINFINLSTAHASKRAKEIGIRKTLGSSRPELVRQFLNETLLVTLLATFISILLTPYLLKLFSDFIPDGVQFNPQREPGIWLFLGLLVLIVTLIAGSYPALVLSSFRPVQVLKNQVQGGGSSRRAMLRKTLTVFQFVIAQIFIIGTLLVGNQISYSLNKDLGFSKDGIIFFSTDYRDTTLSNRLRLTDMIQQMPDVKLTSISNGPPLSTNTWSSTVSFEDKGKKIENSVQIKLADTNYLRMYNISLVAGRELAHSDTMKEYLINETYLHALGFSNPNDIINKQLKYGGQLRPVVGVMRDFHQKSVRERIIPLLVTTDRKRANAFQVSLDNSNRSDWKATIKNIEGAFYKVYPELEFDYKFFDESIEQFYTSEKNTVKLLNWASGLAIFISCLGLLGLVIYITNQRTKEIGIRKVVGANAGQIMVLLSKDFIKLVFLAFLISIPIAWYGTHKWLENFEYRTTISWTLFITGGLILLGIALLTLSIQVIRSAMANPVESLRNE